MERTGNEAFAVLVSCTVPDTKESNVGGAGHRGWAEQQNCCVLQDYGREEDTVLAEVDRWIPPSTAS